MLSPISPLPFISAETRSLEKIGSLFCMWTLSMAHKTLSSNLGTLASKYFTVSFNWFKDVWPTREVVFARLSLAHRKLNSVSEIPDCFAISLYMSTALKAGADLYLYKVEPQL